MSERNQNVDRLFPPRLMWQNLLKWNKFELVPRDSHVMGFKIHMEDLLPVGIAKFAPFSAHHSDGPDVRRRHRHFWARIEHVLGKLFVDVVVQLGDHFRGCLTSDNLRLVGWKKLALVRIARHEAKHVAQILDTAGTTTHNFRDRLEVLVHIVDLLAVAAKFRILIRTFSNKIGLSEQRLPPPPTFRPVKPIETYLRCSQRDQGRYFSGFRY